MGGAPSENVSQEASIDVRAQAEAQARRRYPASEIDRVATKYGYDTIVVGGRELGTIERLLLGSVSEHIATHARATVVIVRPGALVATTTGS